MYTARSAYPARVLEMPHILMAFLRTYRKGDRLRWIPYDEYSQCKLNMLMTNVIMRTLILIQGDHIWIYSERKK